MTRSQGVGTVYLLHFERPYYHARHYLGWTTDLTARLAEHSAGRGARLLTVVQVRGGAWWRPRTPVSRCGTAGMRHYLMACTE